LLQCGKPGHKATERKIEQNVNELFVDKLDLRDKVLAILANNQLEFDKDYYQDIDSDVSACNSPPIQTIDVIITKNQNFFI